MIEWVEVHTQLAMLALQVGNQDEVVERCYDIQDLLKPCWDTFHNYTQQGISGRLSAASNQLRERPPSKLGDPNRWKTLLKLVVSQSPLKFSSI